MLSHIGPTADRLRRVLHDAGYAAGMLAKAGGAPESVYALSGRLIASQSGWAILEVPNALVRGIFAAMDEPGVELPPSGPNDQLNAHISVLTKDELDRIGGPDALSERGQRFRYQLGPIKKVKPSGWDMAAVYMVEVQSPALKKLRVSYGLPPLPHGDHQFHITVCVRKKGTLQAGPVSKAAATDDETQVRAVVRSIPKDDLYGAWYHPGDRKVRVSLGDWSETSGRDVHARLSAVLGKKAVEVEAEIGRPDPFDGWIKLAENTLTRGADTFDIDALIARLHGREPETLPVDAFAINRSRNTGFSPRRLAAADVSFPMIVGPGDDVLDGKHRTVKLRTSGATHGRYLRATPEDLEAVKLAWSRELSSAPAEEVTYDPNLGRPDGVREAACRGPAGRTPGRGPGGAGSIPVGMPLEWLDSASKAAARDFAPGLPRRDDKGDHTKLREGELATWIVQDHQAIRSGPHKDIRVGNPELGMFSWATKKDVPTPGQTVAFHQQPVHRYSYNSFQGTIPSGRYGAGTVRRQDAGEALVTRSTPHKLELTLAHKRDQPRLDLTAIGPVTWLARNTTPTEPVPYAKVHHKSVAPDDLPKVLETLPPGSVGQPKVDGASTLVSLLKRGPELTSYRTSSTSGHPIIQTEKIFHGRPAATYSKDLIGTILKGELYGTHLPRRTDQSETPGTHRQDRGGDRTSADAADLRAHDGGAGPAILHPQQLGAILNSTLANSIRSQRRQGIDLKAMLYDIQQHGKQPIDLATTPYAERRRLLEGIVPHLPPGKFHLSPQVEGPEAIGKLYDDVVSGRNDLTREGVVIHEPTGRPLKVKQTEEHDAVATGMYPGEGRRSRTVGGLLYAHADDPEKTVGRVGGGFDDETLRQIAADPQAFIGRTMRLRAQEKYPETGALRAPRFLAWHEG
jgi:hypothetical protein